MKSIMIAALVAAPISAAAPVSATELPREDVATEQGDDFAGRRVGEPVQLGYAQTQTPDGGDASRSAQPAPAQETEGKKRKKSTGDKVLTGAAIILGIGALAVGGLLVAIFAQ